MAIVAYCCYLSFTDGTIEAAEADTVNAIAEQFGISPAMIDLYRKWNSAYANRNVQWVILIYLHWKTSGRLH
jgi:hypothetical protein